MPEQESNPGHARKRSIAMSLDWHDVLLFQEQTYLYSYTNFFV